ncbi:tetratricopeptide repeat protein [Rhizobium halophytocola]|uniref:Ancillary SecYEG translocon subunit/Cell division coordinator CpoB TPR domain-containing protein n=1 Tax=Rhizobium halophytocola TaxID=735519 RepID=A0ABS4E663_9HYPH|nr:tetratricopeptide repeat protein [Rhizobium halophytocola]MBP1853384.1 hypothetical protein [Rhizobium halophytocola]
MVDHNDSFIREVNDELRSDRARHVWRRYGPVMLVVAVLVVLGTAASVGYEYWQDQRATGSGDAFSAALDLAAKGKTDEAMKAFDKIEAEGHGSYPVLARFRAATLQAESGDEKGAAAAFSDIGKDMSVEDALRDVAHMRAGFLLVDTADYAAVSTEVEAMAVPGNPLRNSAREALGLAAYKANDLSKAREWFEQITEDTDAPGNLSRRAQIMLDNITASLGPA